VSHIYVKHVDADFGRYQNDIYITGAKFSEPEIENMHQALAGALR
jgi:hypothetical protein